eukprot:Tbor_TRINITY_DN5922_c2_g1::TRINITY_DN5922_c2_g1_i1::g.18618::m.18618
MHKAAKTTVVISITEAVFINSYIKLINSHLIPDDYTQEPLLFTMNKSRMNGNSKLEFGSQHRQFRMPPNSSILIIDSNLTISSTVCGSMFIFHCFQLETNSSIEISRNVITMECNGGDTMVV